MVRPKIFLSGLAFGLVAATAVYVFHPEPPAIVETDPAPMLVSIPEKATFSDLAGWLRLATSTANEIYQAAKPKYDLARIVKGRELALFYDLSGSVLRKLVYEINSDEQLTAERNGNGQWEAAVAPIPYEVREKSVSGTVSGSLFGSMESAGLDIRLALALAEMFAWQVDFVADTREGDSYKVVYEERYLAGQYVMPGRILAAEYTNDGEVSKGYYFAGSDKTRAGYYDGNGAALQKQFLKAPLQYKYISSGFSYGRLNPITKKVSPHRGIDYAAPSGTPAVSVGDGTVIQAGWNGYYGISVTIRHNDTYRTVYGHFSSLAKGIRVGAKVRQGQVVGYVGSTGLSTGPHLHYEMHKYSSYVNPFKVEVPPGEPVAEPDREDFAKVVAAFQGKI